MGQRGRGVRSPVKVTAQFVRDVEAQVAWLNKHREPAHLLRLQRELRPARELLSELPLVGPATEEGLRRLLLRTLPFVAWYRVHRGTVVLLRLFHARQKR